jgi:hypothetical protein
MALFRIKIGRVDRLGVLALVGREPHIQAMVTEAKKSPSRGTAKSAGTVLYRGVKITPMTGKRSPLAEAIRDGLRSKSEPALGARAKA